MVKVSAILPIYNAEGFLRQTLDCLINQTLKEIEIICVDDGSKDNSYEIIKEYSEKYDNVIGITQENAGAGAARNKGLSVAKGEYLSFLDADDFFETNMLELAYNHAKKYDSDITVFNSNQYFEETGEYKDINWVVRYNKIPPYNPFKHRQ
ncbi:MAG: glycosyltransferase, partial [Eubacterium sp.]|nr:glycosyltransferase [Eubacterium sp.]